MMSRTNETDTIHRDPLGLGDLPLLEPGYDGWPAIRDALVDRQSRARRLRTVGWLAAAASVVLTVAVTTWQANPAKTGMPAETASVATESGQMASNDEQTIESLISLSSTLESRLRGLRESAGSMPASSAIYVAELEDLVAQVDNQLSQAPGSVNLWGQRVNLLLDLAQIYQQQWEIDYGQMASL